MNEGLNKKQNNKSMFTKLIKDEIIFFKIIFKSKEHTNKKSKKQI